MTTEQQNKTWSNLTPDVRNEIRNMYNNSLSSEVRITLMTVFGYYNIITENE